MLAAMFGMGGTEILVILIVALLFLGPDKLPDAAKKISQGIRDIKRQSRALQQTIEDDEHIGGAIRDLKSALRGDEEPIRPKPIKAPIKELVALPEPGTPAHAAATIDPLAPLVAVEAPDDHEILAPAAPAEVAEAPRLTLPPTAGERDFDEPATSRADEAAELAALVRPAPNTIARGAASAAAAPVVPASTAPVVPASTASTASPEAPVSSDKSEPSHG